jgi:hypothetical protein
VGPNEYGIKFSSIRNIAQVIVIRADGGELEDFQQLLQKNSEDSIAKFETIDLVAGEQYDFLLLMGHKERNYAVESGPEYTYKDDSPTLLMAGLLKGEEIKGGSNSIPIIMYPLIVDTVFKQGEAVKDAVLPSVQPVGVRLLPGIDARVVWTLTEGGYDNLVEAHGKIAQGGGVAPGGLGEAGDPLSGSVKRIWSQIGGGTPQRNWHLPERGGPDYPAHKGAERGGCRFSRLQYNVPPHWGREPEGFHRH